MAKVELLMDGEVFDPNKPRPAMLRVKAVLDKAPPNEVYSIPNLKKLSGVGDCTIRDFAAHPAHAGYSLRHGNRREVWLGHPEAIVLLKKKLAENGR